MLITKLTVAPANVLLTIKTLSRNLWICHFPVEAAVQGNAARQKFNIMASWSF